MAKDGLKATGQSNDMLLL